MKTSASSSVITFLSACTLSVLLLCALPPASAQGGSFSISKEYPDAAGSAEYTTSLAKEDAAAATAASAAGNNEGAAEKWASAAYLYYRAVNWNGLSGADSKRATSLAAAQGAAEQASSAAAKSKTKKATSFAATAKLNAADAVDSDAEAIANKGNGDKSIGDVKRAEVVMTLASKYNADASTQSKAGKYEAATDSWLYAAHFFSLSAEFSATLGQGANVSSAAASAKNAAKQAFAAADKSGSVVAAAAAGTANVEASSAEETAASYQKGN